MENGEIKRFSQYINESSVDMGTYYVEIDMSAGDELYMYAKTFAELARLAPNTILDDMNTANIDYYDVKMVGPKEECQAIADYWNNLRGSNDIVPRLHGLESTLDRPSIAQRAPKHKM
jgi:hypothetical protein